MVHRRQKLLQHILRLHPQAGGIDTGVAAEVLQGRYILVNDELYLVIRVIHQRHNRSGARRYIQQFLHILRRGKGETGGTDWTDPSF